MKKNLILAGLITATVILAVFSVATAIRVKNLGTEPVVPSVPKSKPQAVDKNIPVEGAVPAAGCRASFAVPTPSTVPCTGAKIQGRVYRDGSEAPYRVSETEEFGPVSYRVDYAPPKKLMITNGGNKLCEDSCRPVCIANFVNGSFATEVLPKGEGYSIRLVLNDAKWVVSEAYSANGSGCTNNRQGGAAVSGLQTGSAVVSNINVNCDTINIWFGVKPKAVVTTTPTPTGTITPSLTPTPTPVLTSTPTPTNTPTGVPTATNTPGPTATPLLTNTPVPTTPVTAGPTPTEVKLPQAGLKVPTLGGLIIGFLLISLGAALVF